MAVFGYHMDGAMSNCCCLGAFYVHHTTMRLVTSLHAKPHMWGACMFSCSLPPAPLAKWLGSFMCYYSNMGGGMDTKIGINTESWPWRIFFSCQDSNLWPFSYKSSALIIELSLLCFSLETCIDINCLPWFKLCVQCISVSFCLWTRLANPELKWRQNCWGNWMMMSLVTLLRRWGDLALEMTEHW